MSQVKRFFDALNSISRSFLPSFVNLNARNGRRVGSYAVSFATDIAAASRTFSYGFSESESIESCGSSPAPPFVVVRRARDGSGHSSRGLFDLVAVRRRETRQMLHEKVPATANEIGLVEPVVPVRRHDQIK